MDIRGLTQRSISSDWRERPPSRRSDVHLRARLESRRHGGAHRGAVTDVELDLRDTFEPRCDLTSRFGLLSGDVAHRHNDAAAGGPKRSADDRARPDRASSIPNSRSYLLPTFSVLGARRLAEGLRA